MEAGERRHIRELLRRSRIASKKRYIKKAERSAVIDGYMALKNLGMFNVPAFEGGRREVFAKR